MITLSREVPLSGIHIQIPLTINNSDNDGDGELDVDQLLSPTRDLVLPLEDAGVTGEYHVVVVLYVEGGGRSNQNQG
jgi:hypothetical protein